MELDSMYQEIILEHYRRPLHAGLREPFDAQVQHINPTCGDEVTLRVTLKDAGGEPVLADVSYDTLGCSISQASASMMADMIIGKTVGEAMAISEEFLKLMQSRGEARTGRGHAGRRGRVRGRIEVSGQDQVRAAELDGLERRDRAGAERTGRDRACSTGPRWEEAMTENSADLMTEPETADSGGGLAASERVAAGSAATDQETEDLLEAMRDVVDPELGVNVVDLGLVYGVTMESDRTATIDMTLTSAACPLTDMIEDQTRMALDGLVQDFRINWVWLPPWGPEKITEDGREQLRALGFNV